MNSLKKFGVAFGVVILIAVFITLIALTSESQKNIKEKTFADRKDLKFTSYCLKGKVVLNINADDAISAASGSYVYELDANGKPIACQ